MNAINKSEFRRFVSARYPGGHWCKSTGTYFNGTHEYLEAELLAEAEIERLAWRLGLAEKPEWIKR